MMSFSALALFAEANNPDSLLEQWLGIDLPDIVIAIVGVAVILIIVIAFIAKGFFAELNKKNKGKTKSKKK